MNTKRAFLSAIALVGASPRSGWADVGNLEYLAATGELNGSFLLFDLKSDGTEVFRTALPARRHSGTGHFTRAEAVLFARRPGKYDIVVDCVSGRVLEELEPPSGLQFKGH